MTAPAAPIAALQALDGLAVAGADAVACQRWLREAKRVRGFVDAVEAQVTARLEVLAAQGEAFGATDTHVNCSGVSAAEAERRRRRAQALDRAAGFGEALATGSVSAEHVDVLAAATHRLADGVRDDVFAHSGELLERARSTSPDRFGRYVRDLARRLERRAGVSRDAQQRAAAFLSWKIDPGTGMYDIHGALHPELGARFVTAIRAEVAARIKAGEAAGDPACVDRTVDRGRLAAEVMVDFVSASHQLIRPIVADLTVITDAETVATGEQHDHTICETGDGALLPIESLRRLLCNARLTPLIVDSSGNPLFAGRTLREANRAQRRALRVMYRTCAAEGCEVPFDRCEAHHIVWWERGGRTDLDNLLPLCAHHHHLAHALGWQLSLAPDRTLTVTDRHGRVLMVTTPDMPHWSHTHRRRGRPIRATSNLLAG